MAGIRNWIHKHAALAGVIGILIAGLAFWMAIRARNSDFGPATEPLHRGRVVESVYGIGTVTARNIFNLKLGVTSTVRDLFVMEGDEVRKGQKLISLDGTGTPVAPFGGTVTSLPVKPGETVFAQTPILTLVDLKDRYAVVSLEQRGAVRVRRGQQARLSFDNMRDQLFDGEVESVYSNLGNFLVRIRVQSLPPQILPGMTADVAILIGEKPDVLLIPTAAIDAGKVYVQRGVGGPKSVEIRTGIVDGDMAELVSGDIHDGERLVVRKKVAR
jgi:multidrug efflux pump subunit AcrA (membrane-fusion protein)